MKRNAFLLSLLLASILAISGCGGGKSTTPKRPAAGPANADFPVNEKFATALAAEGIPADIARFLAAARIESANPVSNTFVYNLFYPNGAIREITMKFTPNQTHTLTGADITKVSAGATPIYDFKYANTLGPQWTGRLDIEYFIPDEGMPAALLAGLKKTAALSTPGDLFVSLPGPGAMRSARAAAAPGDSVPGFSVAWGESAKTGADVAIGSLIDAARDRGVGGAGKVAGIYAVASGASAIGGAMVLSQQTGKWMTELDKLEECAANPTSPVARSDPNYSKSAVEKVQSARGEIQEVTAVRFLNQATETASGLDPASSVASIALKQGFIWGEQTLGDYSENTVMREVRLAVVRCGEPDPSPPQQGNVITTESWTEPATGRQGSGRSVANVKLVYNRMTGWYDIVGTFRYEQTVTERGFTYKSIWAGEAAGTMVIIPDLTQARLIGHDYSGGGIMTGLATLTNTTTDPKGFSRTDTRTGTGMTVGWFPAVKGFRGAGGAIAGTATYSMDSDNSRGTRTVTYELGVPPR